MKNFNQELLDRNDREVVQGQHMIECACSQCNEGYEE